MAEAPHDEGHPRPELHDPAPAAPEDERSQHAPTDGELDRRVDDVLYSEIGISTLLDRLKMSIASARNLSIFLKKRSMLEEDHAASLRKLSRITHDGLRAQDVRQGSFVNGVGDVMQRHDRMADNGNQFAMNLHTMHEDLQDLTNNCEKGRKYWKQVGLNAEKRAFESELQMEKAKVKYDGSVEDYLRATSGDRTSGSKRFNLKAGKLGPQSDEDILKRVEASENDYAAKVEIANSQRKELLSTSRPQAIKSLQDLIAECDSGVTLQLQKFATFNEKLFLNHGIIISPIKGQTNGGPEPRSMRDSINSIKNENDFKSHVALYHGKFPLKPSEFKFERNMKLGAAHLHGSGSPHPPPLAGFQHQRTNSGNMRPSTPTRGYSETESPQNSYGYQQGYPQQQAYQPYAGQPYPQGQQPVYGSPGGASSQHRLVQENGTYAAPVPPYNNRPSTSDGAPAPPEKGPSALSSHQMAYRAPQPQAYQQQPPQEQFGPTLLQNSYQPPPQQTGPAPQMAYAAPVIQPQPQPHSPISHSPQSQPRPAFGVSLEELFKRDATPVPIVLTHVFPPLEQFCLHTPQLYEHPGTTANITRLRTALSQSPLPPLNSPPNFFNDPYSLAAVAKQFLRELPDPLLTRDMYHDFVDAARLDDDIVRRDTLHANINSLPDANYATLRALVLHLNRVQTQAGANGMGITELSRCFGGVVLGGEHITFDLPAQMRVLETILVNALQIFDED